MSLGADSGSAVDAAASTQTRISRQADTIAKYFVLAIVLVAASLVLFGVGGSIDASLRRVLALSVVSCPCAFAFTAPLAWLLALRSLGREGVFVKDAAALERIAGLHNVFLDKTGTLSFGRLRVTDWEGIEGNAGLAAAILALENRSHHPIARAVVASLGAMKRTDTKPREVGDFKENPGVGVEGVIDGKHYRIRALPQVQTAEKTVLSETGLVTRIGVYENDALVAKAALSDELRPDSASAVRQLKRLGLTPWLLSGDDTAAVAYVAKETGISEEHQASRLSPERKAELVRNSPDTLMVGDGANDAIALAAASVGVAVHGSMELSLRAADIYLTRPGVAPLVDLVRKSRHTIRVIRLNFLISAAYNAIGISLAATGILSPLIAAVLMPISSLSVLAVTFHGMRTGQRTIQ